MSVLSRNHWGLETYTQRMSAKEWREILLAEQDTVVFKGQVYKLIAKNIGYGLVDVSKTVEKQAEKEQEKLSPDTCKDYEALQRKLDISQVELEAAKVDSARLDWLQAHRPLIRPWESEWIIGSARVAITDIREAIDAVMKRVRE